MAERHLNKRPGGAALYRGGGASGSSERRVVASVKSNLGAPPRSLVYGLADAANGALWVAWLGAGAEWDAP